MSGRDQAGTVPRPERRGNARLPRAYQISYFAAAGDDAGQWHAARVRDVSPGGICVVADRHVAVGAKLTLCFRAKGEATTLLAQVRVVRAAALPERDWLLGCRFVAVLGAGDFAQVLERTSAAG